jgi:hypothetical protein
MPPTMKSCFNRELRLPEMTDKCRLAYIVLQAGELIAEIRQECDAFAQSTDKTASCRTPKEKPITSRLHRNQATN